MEEFSSLTGQEDAGELKTKIRFLSNAIREHTEQAQTDIKKQDDKIKRLKKENAQLNEEITNLQKIREPRPSTRASSALAPVENYQEKIDQEVKQIKEYEVNIKIIQEKIFKQRQQMGGINASRDTANALNKQLRILENRLDKANQKFNEAIAHNKQLREQIDNLRRERVIFDNIYQKLEKELHDRRKDMAEIIEEANSAYEARDRAQTQLASLKQTAKREQEEFEKEWRQLNALIEKDKKMKEFLKLKQQEREQVDFNDSPKNEDDSTRKKGKVPTVGQIAAERVRSYEEAFNKIQAATGITDIDTLVNTFITAEEKNFKLFKFVNELSNEIENLESQITELQDEIQSYRGRDAGANEHKKRILRELEEKLDKYTKKAEHYNLQYQNHQSTLNHIKDQVNMLFDLLDCDREFAMEFIGSGVSDNNLQQYLGLIEQRASEILQAYTLLQNKKGRSEFVIAGPRDPPGTSLVKIEAPNVKDDISDREDEDAEEVKPLNPLEFRQIAERKAQSQKLQQRKAKTGKNRNKKQFNQ